MSKQSAYFDKFYSLIDQFGGIHNAHLHLDRAGILDEKYFFDTKHNVLDNSHVALHEKHKLINNIHNGPAYETQDLTNRVNRYLDVLIETNTRRADTLVDVTADKVGLTALQTLTEIKNARKSEIDLRLGAYSPLGFNNKDKKSWEIFTEGAKQADFIAALPEADDNDDYPENIGFMEHCKRTLELATNEQLPLHVHTDQRNEPSETGTERLIEAIKQYGAPVPNNDEPMIWAVHMISPSTYDEDRFQKLVQNLVDHNIGVICCPSAAIGMRQYRPISTPTYNSIPRILELAAAGIHIRLASDNISDICSPTTTADLTDEIIVLSSAIRFYHVGIMAKFAAGIKLSRSDIGIIKEHLNKNTIEINTFMKKIENNAF